MFKMLPMICCLLFFLVVERVDGCVTYDPKSGTYTVDNRGCSPYPPEDTWNEPLTISPK